jgi:hypothetical protein
MLSPPSLETAMRIPKGLDHKPGLQLAIGLFIVVALVLTSVGKCSRAAQWRGPSTSEQSITPPAPVVSGENGGAGSYEPSATQARPAVPGTMTTVGPGDAPIVITR